MALNSAIEWTESTWNPTTGCSKVSPGCKYCYAEKMALRLKAMGARGYENGFELTLQPHRLKDPLKRKKPTVYFVNSMSDLFHEDIPDKYIGDVFDVMRQASHHTFQVLTKRADRMSGVLNEMLVPGNVWIGVTVENKTHGIPRIEKLRQIKARIRFLSIEPMLEDLEKLNLKGLHWVIVGGESGPKARPMQSKWVQKIRVQCEKERVLFFFKQWGGWGADGKKRNKKANGRMLYGKIWGDVPSTNSIMDAAL